MTVTANIEDIKLKIAEVKKIKKKQIEVSSIEHFTFFKSSK